MVIIKKADFLTNYISQLKSQKHRIGFVPTMGALHQGHLSLIQSSRLQNQLTVCSIFVNPTQFNNADDFKNYPISIEDDIAKLTSAGCDVLFFPELAEIYPAGHETKHFDLGPVEFMLEGKHRPGHFQGVCQVVDRLLQIVNPDTLYLGQKDLQQCRVINKLLELTGREHEIDLKIEPTIREEDGLAMSSRNRRLGEDERRNATALFDALNLIKKNLTAKPIDQLIKEATTFLEEKGFDVDYVEVADAETLLPGRDPGKKLAGLVAASVGKIRLIDNMALNMPVEELSSTR